jgi:type IV pilus assembly protein PilN
MRVEINLASHPYEDSRLFWMRWGIALGAISLFTLIMLYVLVSSFLLARKDRKLMEQAQQQIADRDHKKSDAQALLNLPQNSSIRDRSQFLNDVFQRKAFSWTRVFEDLEQLMPPGLHLISIHPDKDSGQKDPTPDGRVKFGLEVAGTSRDRAEQLVEKMEGSHRFQQTQILEEEAQPGMQGGDTVRFAISAMYVPQAEPANNHGAAAGGGQ